MVTDPRKYKQQRASQRGNQYSQATGGGNQLLGISGQRPLAQAQHSSTPRPQSARQEVTSASVRQQQESKHKFQYGVQFNTEDLLRPTSGRPLQSEPVAKRKAQVMRANLGVHGNPKVEQVIMMTL